METVTTRELTCIGCPMGCPLTVTMEAGEVISVTGNTCKRGDVYARKEVTNPTRIVTSTVRVSGGDADMVSVKTKEDIPKGKIFECVKALKSVEVPAPIHTGAHTASHPAGTLPAKQRNTNLPEMSHQRGPDHQAAAGHAQKPA